MDSFKECKFIEIRTGTIRCRNRSEKTVEYSDSESRTNTNEDAQIVGGSISNAREVPASKTPGC